jgi:DNA-binding response OmpR family regulator
MISSRTSFADCDPKSMSSLLGSPAARGPNISRLRLRRRAAIRRSPSRPAPRVLCIEDDREFARALQFRLESRGISVLHAATGLDGFCTAVGESADAILLDYQLPNGCGHFILQQLKENLATSHIPVIVISGTKDRALEYTLVNVGAVRFFQKPFDFEELMSELCKHLTT